MSTTSPRIQLPARQLLLWLILLIGLVTNAALSLAHLVLAGGTFLVITLWVVRVLVLASCWLVPGRRSTKLWAMGVILGALVLDAVLKAPVIGTVEYGDWFLVRSLDLTDSYSGYLITCGFLLPLLVLTGWLILRPKRAAGWITALTGSLIMSWVMLMVSNSESATTTVYILLGVARWVLPAWAAVLADRLAKPTAARQNLSTNSRRPD
ncbi:hypothetical protein [Glutamicibacter uratoxydans]|uniref:hypothetical protein n=1 Tax=Glutamicibacter uratoxydans TaxID=43667 RepID=UPI003D6EEDD9